ncbi:uncharacterized protein EURHEDRAFT_386473 [Aspergillus ruber CBS 135680]|uniref:Uncharacterized protein n=1 Tax=Aspergillus ruber (strain CBS 135680) TaxID=1388766 RepID=A0A017SFW1_ASPRC|nr:uncharacterized protein EURHEDRAFT_386473 [Aspergillus ruber CBS 135680]EYE95150.1 hypothetical protein EURHEDRAFT_386473 [Aspergillus ruber CBS 135680]
MTQVRLAIGYNAPAAYEKYGKDIWDLVETKFGELGIEEFGPFRSAQSYPPVQFVGLEVPYNVSIYDLRSVKLGEGIWTDVSVVDEYSED